MFFKTMLLGAMTTLNVVPTVSAVDYNIRLNEMSEKVFANGDAFPDKDINTKKYSAFNSIEEQSQLMLNADYFNQGLNPSDYAFNLGFNVSDKVFGDGNSNDFWNPPFTVDYDSSGGTPWESLFNRMNGYKTKFNFDVFASSLDASGRTTSRVDLYYSYFTENIHLTNNLGAFNFVFSTWNSQTNNYDFLKITILNSRYIVGINNVFSLVDVFFKPFIGNQSVYSFSNFDLCFNYNFMDAIFSHWDSYSAFDKFSDESSPITNRVLWTSWTGDSVSDYKTEFDDTKIVTGYGESDFVKYVNKFFSISAEYLFDLDPLTYLSAFSDFNLPLSIFIKNGFQLYPSHFYFAGSYIYTNQFNLITNYVYNINNGLNYYSFLTKASKSNFTWFTTHSKSDDIPTVVDDLNVSKTPNIFQGINEIMLYPRGTSDLTRLVRYYDFNLGLFNADDFNDFINNGSTWELPYSKCGITHLFGCITNAVVWTFNNVPGIKEFTKLFGGLVNAYKGYVDLWHDINEYFAFNLAFDSLIYGSLMFLIIRAAISWL